MKESETVKLKTPHGVAVQQFVSCHCSLILTTNKQENPAFLSQWTQELIRADGPDLCKTKNEAAMRAKGRVLLFVDDDVTFSTEKTELFLRDFFNGGKEHVELVTGRLLTPYNHLLFDELCSQDLGGEARLFFPSDVRLSIRTAANLVRASVRKLFCKQLRQYAPAPWGIGNGSMFAITKEFFQSIGGFDESLKPTEGASACEDVDLFYRALLSGSLAAYSPKLVGYHHHGRISEAAAKSRASEYFRGNINLATRHAANRYIRILRLAMLAANKPS